jgi:hypothetical protein
MKKIIYQLQVIKTITTKPSAATNLRATETTTSSTVLDWDPSVDEAVTGYNVL